MPLGALLSLVDFNSRITEGMIGGPGGVVLSGVVVGPILNPPDKVTSDKKALLLLQV